MHEVLELYTDGSCLGNPGDGGWAVVLKPFEGEQIQCWRSGREIETTNNRMELEAVIQAIDVAYWNFKNIIKKAKIFSDSKYVIMGITGQWEMKANLDLWKSIESQKKAYKNVIEFEFHWLKGHAGHPLNELADQIAKQRIKTFIANTI